MKNKLFVFMIDALCEFDVSYMRTLPNFGSILERGALVEEMLPVYPSFTYPCHVSIMTGCYPDRHGIPHNEMVQAGVHPVPWYTKREMVKKKFFAEYAKEAGYTTCLINWPVSAGADVDLNLPMIVPMGYHGDNPRQYYEGVSTPELLDRYFWKYGHLLRGLNKPINGSLDMFTNAVAPDIIRDYHQPDVIRSARLCDLDSIRHDLGVDTDFAREQLKKHDCELGVLMESIRRYGDFEHTEFRHHGRPWPDGRQARAQLQPRFAGSRPANAQRRRNPRRVGRLLPFHRHFRLDRGPRPERQGPA